METFNLTYVHISTKTQGRGLLHNHKKHQHEFLKKSQNQTTSHTYKLNKNVLFLLNVSQEHHIMCHASLWLKTSHRCKQCKF